MREGEIEKFDVPRDDYAADYRLSCVQPVWVYPSEYH